MPSPLDALLSPGSPQLKSPWATLGPTPERRGYIAGANGENVINDYAAGGKYSSYNSPLSGSITRNAPDLQTLSSGGENHAQAWAKGNTSPQKIQGPLAGMPYQLSKIAEKNLNTDSNQINAFNEKARQFSFGSAHSDNGQPSITANAASPTSVTPVIDRRFHSGTDQAYHQVSNPNLTLAGAAKPAVGVEDQRRTSQAETEY